MRRELQATAGRLTLILLSASGCGETATETVPSIPTARSEASASSQQSIDAPLTDADVQTFLTVVEALPDGQVPALRAKSLDVTGADSSPAALARAWRAEFRRRFDPGYHAALWAEDETLQTVLAEHHLTPAEFASLVMRISFAMTSLAVESRLDVSELTAQSEQQLQRIIHKLAELDDAAQNDPANAPLLRHRREQTARALAEVVAVSEFGQLLQRVPAENRAVIGRHRQQLNATLPRGGNLAHFERSLESGTGVVPASHETPAVDEHSTR
ncbi:hypothetical protein Mal4_58930 [Maioricimonas rarisocia]|uniref:Uncharacterized protein n=1 Tax=Maioricimonas rarisocia TaxID=2528026 RepID=A0A517ZGC5_9PLAN|nr:hypothetical protein [Maioricimonas rarisocia]QDU41525.1 hypothetical protein Mal4_58930 [Maioricimonas rarisocia]